MQHLTSDQLESGHVSRYARARELQNAPVDFEDFNCFRGLGEVSFSSIGAKTTSDKNMQDKTTPEEGKTMKVKTLPKGTSKETLDSMTIPVLKRFAKVHGLEYTAKVQKTALVAALHAALNEDAQEPAVVSPEEQTGPVVASPREQLESLSLRDLKAEATSKGIGIKGLNKVGLVNALLGDTSPETGKNAAKPKKERKARKETTKKDFGQFALAPIPDRIHETRKETARIHEVVRLLSRKNGVNAAELAEAVTKIGPSEVLEGRVRSFLSYFNRTQGHGIRSEVKAGKEVYFIV